MSAGDETPRDHAPDRFDQLCHDLKSPLTTAYARTQLVARMIRRSTTLSELERGTMLDGLAAVEQALRAMGPLIDGISSTPPGIGDRHP
jgi:hypothetical protein